MLNASVGVQRVIGRLRRPSSEGPTPDATLHDPPASPWLSQVRSRLHAVAGIAHLAAGSDRRRTRPMAARPVRRSLIGRIGQDRVVAVAVAGIVLVASVASVSAEWLADRSAARTATAPPRGSSSVAAR